MSTDVESVVGPVVQRLMARRLGMAGITLGLTVALGLAEWALFDLGGTVHLTTILGPLFCVAPLLALGMRGVRRAFGDPPRPWMTLARASSLVPFAFGLWLLTIRGLRSFAVGGTPTAAWLVYAVWVVLGLRILHDMSRVNEVERLASTMMMPAPGEAVHDHGR